MDKLPNYVKRQQGQ